MQEAARARPLPLSPLVPLFDRCFPRPFWSVIRRVRIQSSYEGALELIDLLSGTRIQQDIHMLLVLYISIYVHISQANQIIVDRLAHILGFADVDALELTEIATLHRRGICRNGIATTKRHVSVAHYPHGRYLQAPILTELFNG